MFDVSEKATEMIKEAFKSSGENSFASVSCTTREADQGPPWVWFRMNQAKMIRFLIKKASLMSLTKTFLKR